MDFNKLALYSFSRAAAAARSILSNELCIRPFGMLKMITIKRDSWKIIRHRI